jgi:ArsR family transcriptional regulator
MNQIPRCCRSRKLPQDLVQTARVNAVLSDGNRLRILCLLKNGELCVCEIWRLLSLAQNLVSHHLMMLKKAGLLHSRKDGLRVFYSINQPRLRRHIIKLKSLIK